MDIRDRDPNAAKRWSDETVFSNRAYFLFDKLPGELAVQNAKDSDTGKYLMLKHVGEGRAIVWNQGARISENLSRRKFYVKEVEMGCRPFSRVFVLDSQEMLFLKAPIERN